MSRAVARRRGRGPDRASLIRFALFAAVTVVASVLIAQQIVAGTWNERYELVATFDDVTGLLEGDQVKVAGAPVGRVNSVRVVRGRAEVRMEVDRGVRLPADSTAAIRWRNMIGQRMIYLEPGTSTDKLGDGASFKRTRSVVDLGEIVNSLGPLTRSLDPNQLNQVLNAFAQTLDGNTDNVNAMIRYLELMLDTFAQRKEAIRSLTEDYSTISGAVAKRDQQIARSLDNLTQLTEVFAQNSRLLDSALVEISGVTTDLDAVLGGNERQLGRLVDSLNQVSGTVRLNVDNLEKMVQRLPLALRQLFSAFNGGHYMRSNVMCLTVAEGNCPFPMTPPGSSGPPTTAELKKLQKLLRGEQ